MGSESVGEYDIEYSGVRLDDVDGWAAWVAIYCPGSNPMHRNSVVPGQRVALEQVFATESDAEAEAHTVALAMLAERAPKV